MVGKDFRLIFYFYFYQNVATNQFVDYSATFWMRMQKKPNFIYIEFEFWSALHIYSEDKNILEWFRIDPEGVPWRFQGSR